MVLSVAGLVGAIKEMEFDLIIRGGGGASKYEMVRSNVN